MNHYEWLFNEYKCTDWLLTLFIPIFSKILPFYRNWPSATRDSRRRTTRWWKWCPVESACSASTSGSPSLDRSVKHEMNLGVMKTNAFWLCGYILNIKLQMSTSTSFKMRPSALSFAKFMFMVILLLICDLQHFLSLNLCLCLKVHTLRDQFCMDHGVCCRHTLRMRMGRSTFIRNPRWRLCLRSVRD